MSHRPSLKKQIAGAVIGGMLGLLVYGMYKTAEPHLTAWTSIPQKWLPSNGEGSALADNDRTDRTNDHFSARAREIAEKFGAAYKTYQVQEAAPEDAVVAPDASNVSSVSTDAESSVQVMPMKENLGSSMSAPSWIDMEESAATEDIGDGESIETVPGPQTDELPDSGIGVLGAAAVACASTAGLRWRKKRKQA